MAIFLALAGALVYGAADFLGGLASRRTSVLAVTVWSQAAGLAVLAIALPLLGGSPQPSDFLWGAAVGCCGAVAVAALYRGLSIGTMGVVSPITAVLAAAIPVIYGVLRGERPSLPAVLGIIAALVAVVCVSWAPKVDSDAPLARERTARLFPPGVPEALVAGAAFGVFFIVLAQTRTAAGMYPLLSARFASLALLIGGGLLLPRAGSLRVARPAIGTVLLAGALDMTANVLYIAAAHKGMLSIVAVLTSLYPAATVALAAIVLRERLGRIQWVGVAIALGGVVAISANP